MKCIFGDTKLFNNLDECNYQEAIDGSYSDDDDSDDDDSDDDDSDDDDSDDDDSDSIDF